MHADRASAFALFRRARTSLPDLKLSPRNCHVPFGIMGSFAVILQTASHKTCICSHNVFDAPLRCATAQMYGLWDQKV